MHFFNWEERKKSGNWLTRERERERERKGVLVGVNVSVLWE